MRSIGELRDEKPARTFGDFLLSRGIENHVETEDSGAYSIWVLSDEHVQEAEGLFEEFQKNPDMRAMREATQRAEAIRAEKKRETRRFRGKPIDVRTTWARRAQPSFGGLTFGLIGLSIATFVMQYLFREQGYVTLLFFSLPHILRGEVWRIITPIFVHFGIMHILFNMMWLRDLGGAIESRQGPWLLAAQVLLIGALSNLGQYLWTGPQFGGMSGVVYGLLGYLWIRGHYDPASGYQLDRQTVGLMIVWFFLCLTGMLGPVANVAHGVGLATGMTWGFLSSGKLARLLR